MPPPRGKFIVIEGLDRAGKSTQVERLVSNLNKQGHKAEQIRFPNRSTSIGQSINAYLQGSTHTNDHAIHLLFSANRWEAVDSIKTKLECGTTLVVDRYSFSGAVYSAAKQIPNLDLTWAWNMEIGLPQPDLVIYLTVTPEMQAARGGFGLERYETRQMQREVRLAFEALWMRWDASEVCLRRVEADGSLEEVEKRVFGLVEHGLDGVVRPLGMLRALN